LPVHSAPTIIAEALGVAAGPGPGCRCSICGDSPYSAAGKLSAVGEKFSAHAQLPDPEADTLCRGCERLLAGRPGSKPPPLRTVSFLVQDGTLRELRSADFWPILTSPPPGTFVASWAISRQVHHWLHARTSTASLLRIGSDHGTIEYVPDRDRELVAAVQSLLYSPAGPAPLLSRRSILSGDYHPSAVGKFGAARLRDLDRVIEPRRGDPLLPLLVASAPVHNDHPEETAMIDPADQQAARLLACIAASSDHRRRDGKAFWSGFFRHRVERFKDLDLAQFVSRMLDECSCSGQDSVAAARILRDMPEETMRAVRSAISDRPALCVALSYDAMTSGA
jgi:hypothetical protein